MSGEILGSATLELDADLAPLDRDLAKAERRVATSVAVMQKMLDSLHANVDVEVNRLGMLASRLEQTTTSVRAPGPATVINDRTVTSRTSAGPGQVWGVRGPDHPGSLMNPLVVVVEAAKRTTMGSYAAAMGEDDVSDTQRGTGNMATAADMAALTSAIHTLAGNITDGQRLATAGTTGIGDRGSGERVAVALDDDNTRTLERMAATLARIDQNTQPDNGSDTTVAGAAPGNGSNGNGAPTTVLANGGGSNGGNGRALVMPSARSDRPIVVQTDKPVTVTAPKATPSAATLTAATAAGRLGVPVSRVYGLASAGRLSGAQKQGGQWSIPEQAVMDMLASSGDQGGGGRIPPIAVGAGGGAGGDNNRLGRRVLWGGGGAFGLAGMGSLASLAGLGPEHFLTSGLGVLGSATTAAAGAGTLALGSLGKMLVGGGSDMLANATTAHNVKTLSKDLNSLSQAVALYGANSKQAAQAQKQLSYDMQQAGPAAQAELAVANQLSDLQDTWARTSAGAQKQASAIFRQVLTLATQYAPMVAQAAQRNLSIIDTGLRPLFVWLEGPHGIGIFENLENNFARTLPTAVHAFDQGMELVLRVMSLASNDTGGLVSSLDHLFTRLNSRSDFQLNTTINRLVGDFRMWETFVKMLIIDIADLFKQDAGTGASIVQTLTQMLDKLHAWEISTQGKNQLHNIFEVHKQEILELLQLLPPLLSGLGSIYMTLAPPLTLALTGILHVVVDLLNAVVGLGPAARDLLGLALLAGKIGVLGTALNAVGGALGLINRQAADTKIVDATVGQLAGALNAQAAAAQRATAANEELAASDKTLAGSEGVAAGAGDAGLLARVAPSAMGASLGAKAGAAVGEGGLLGLSAAKIEGAVSAAFAPALGALGGMVGGSIVQGVLHLRGGMAGTVGGGVAGAGLGLALSTVIGPLGPALGALLGSTVGSTFGPTVAKPIEHILHSLFGSPDYGKQFSEQFVSQFGNLVPAQSGKEMQQAVDKAYNALAQAQKNARPLFGMNPQQPIITPGAQQALDRAYANLGRTVGQQFVKGLQNVPYPSEPALAIDFLQELQKLPPKSRAAAAQAMVAFAAQLQQDGRLPAGSVQKILTEIEAYFPALTRTFDRAGGAAGESLRAMENNVAGTVSNIRDNFGLLNIDKNVNGSNLLKNIQKAYPEMRAIVANTTGQAHQEAVAAFHQLQQQMNGLLVKMADQVSFQMALIKGHVTKQSAVAAVQGSSSFQKFEGAVYTYMNAGAIDAGRAAAKIIAELNQALKQLGQPQLNAVQVSGVARATDINQQVSEGYLPHGGGGVPHGATGMKVNAPMYVVGEESPAHPEYVLATNPAYRPRNLGLWAQAGQALGVPGFAQGGIIGYSGLEQLWNQAGGNPGIANVMAAIAEAESGGNPTARNPSGASGLWQILGLPFPGNPFDPLTNARMAFIKYATQGLGAWVTYTSGAYRRFLNGANAAAGAFAIPDITAPNVTGRGGYANIIRGGLAKLANASNAYLQAHMPAMGMLGGGMPFHHGKFVFPLPAGSWRGGQLDQGWDISAPGNTPEYAIASGTIAGHGIGGFGPWAPILRLDGGGAVYYGHAGPAGELPVGTHVNAGQIIGSVGPGIVGISTGPHLEIGWYPPGSGSGASMKAALGFAKGGLVDFAGAFANGGMVTANRPTMAVFGENGTETAMFMPHMATGGLVPSGSVGQISVPWTRGETTAQWQAAFTRAFDARFNQIFNRNYRFDFTFDQHFDKAFTTRFNAQFTAWFRRWYASYIKTAKWTQQNWTDQATGLGNELSVVQAIQALNPGTSLSHLGFTPAILKTLGIGNGQKMVGTSLSYWQGIAQNQGGSLTKAQWKQAYNGVFDQNYLLKQQEQADAHVLFDQQWTLKHSHMTGSAYTQQVQAMTQTAQAIAQLESTIQQNDQSLKDLTKATNANTQATMTGAVSFTYQGQSYLAGQSSDNSLNLGVGG